MSFLQTSFKTSYITDLILPPAPKGKTPEDVFTAGLTLALNMAQSPETMSRLNPFVYSVQTMSSTDPHAVDVNTVAAHFGVNPNPNAPYAAGEFVHYEIKDKLPVALGWSAHLTYYSAIRRTRGGIEALTNPGSGVLLHGSWIVRVAEGAGGLVVNRAEEGDGEGEGEGEGEGDVTSREVQGEGEGEAEAEGGGGGGSGREREPGTGTGTGTETEPGMTTSAPASASPATSGVLNLLETNTISCSVLVAWYIRASMDKGHRTAHRRFKEQWTRGMAEMGYPSA